MRKKPLEQVTVSEMAMLIRQQMSHPILVPLAVALLEREPLMDSDLYEGELLSAVLGVGRPFWVAHPDLARRMLRAANAAYETLAQVQPRATGGIEHQLMAEIEFFREKCAGRRKSGDANYKTGREA